MKKLLVMFTAALIMLINVTSSVNAAATSTHFEIEGTLTEFNGVDDFLEYHASKGWVHEPWYSNDYYDDRISSIGLMRLFVYIPNEYKKEDITKIWLDDVKIIVFLNDGSKVSERFRDSVDSTNMYTPHEFYYSTGNDAEYTKIDFADAKNVMYDYIKTDYSGVYLRFSSLEELQDYIANEKWNDELWYHPAREDIIVSYMKTYIRNYLFIPVKYTKDDIYEIEFALNCIVIVFKNNSYFSYKYTIFDKAASISAPTFWINATTTSTSGISTSHTTVYNIMSDNSTNKVVKPLERCSLSANNAMILPFICLSAS